MKTADKTHACAFYAYRPDTTIPASEFQREAAQEQLTLVDKTKFWLKHAGVPLQQQEAYWR